MINENKVKLMTQMALYDVHEGKKDVLINEYYLKDYVSYHIIISLLWATLGYGLGLGFLAIAYMDTIMENLDGKFIVAVAFGVIIGFISILFLIGIISYFIYERRHTDAKRRMKRYNRDLIRLMKMQKGEKREYE